MFGRRRREQEAAAEAAREAERRALFAKLAQRPEHICPFLGLASDRTGYVDGVSDEHRCFAFGEPAPLSAEQQTRVCQERGYGNCPRYLRGVLVIPTEELEALRQRRAPLPEPVPAAAAASAPPARRRRGLPLLALATVLVLLVGAGAAVLLFGEELGISLGGPTPSPSAAATAVTTPSAVPPSVAPSATAAATPSATAQPTPTPEPTPESGDTFAFYEVSVGPAGFTLFEVDDASGTVTSTFTTSFDGYSFARVAPLQGADGKIYWETQDGDLVGWSYTYPDSGEFRIRAVFLNAAGERRSAYLETSQLTVFPEATPAP